MRGSYIEKYLKRRREEDDELIEFSSRFTRFFRSACCGEFTIVEYMQMVQISKCVPDTAAYQVFCNVIRSTIVETFVTLRLIIGRGICSDLIFYIVKLSVADGIRISCNVCANLSSYEYYQCNLSPKRAERVWGEKLIKYLSK